MVSLAAPGSAIDNGYPSAQVGAANFVGSGTSFSAAITSGAAALVLADNPGLSPNEVKARLLGTAAPGPVGNPFVDGHGALDAYAAATAGPMDYHQSATGLIGALLGATVSLSPTGSGRHLEPEPVVRAQRESGRPVAGTGTAWRGAERTGTAGPAGPGTTGAGPGPSWNGEDWSRPGLERRGLGRVGLERGGLERLPPGTARHGSD